MPDETIALVFVDIEDSTKGWFDDQRGMLELLESYIDLVERRLHPPPRIESFTGDGHLLSFPTVDAAATATLRLRLAWDERRASFNRAHWNATHRLRIGIHYGRVARLDDGRIVGTPINVCARTMSAADPGEILLTQTALLTFESKRRYHVGAGRQEHMKGIHAAPTSVELVYGIDADAMPVYPLIGLRPQSPSLAHIPEQMTQMVLDDAVLQSGFIRSDAELDLFARCTAPGTERTQALTLAHAFVALHPNSVSAQVALAHAQRLNGNEKGAQRSLKKAQVLARAESKEDRASSSNKSLPSSGGGVASAATRATTKGGKQSARRKAGKD